jgi:hypothetical protein
VLQYLLEVHQRTSTGRTVAKARAAIEAGAIEKRWDATPFRADIVHRFVQGAQKSKPSEPKPPVTFDAAELLRCLAQHPPSEGEKLARAALLAMVTGPWRLADAMSLRPSKLKTVNDLLLSRCDAADGSRRATATGVPRRGLAQFRNVLVALCQVLRPSVVNASDREAAHRTKSPRSRAGRSPPFKFETTLLCLCFVGLAPHRGPTSLSSCMGKQQQRSRPSSSLF